VNITCRNYNMVTSHRMKLYETVLNCQDNFFILQVYLFHIQENYSLVVNDPLVGTVLGQSNCHADWKRFTGQCHDSTCSTLPGDCMECGHESILAQANPPDSFLS
jgi:hypothetical protein